MARGEITGKKPVQTPDRSKRHSGPPSADATAIEPTAKNDPDSHTKGQATPIRGPPVPPLAAFFGVEQVNRAGIAKLLAAMRKHTKPVAPQASRRHRRGSSQATIPGRRRQR